MKALCMLAGAAVVMAMSTPSICQPAPTTGFHQVQCAKINAGKGVEFRKWQEGDLHKYAQAMVDSGRLSSWALIRAVTPAGNANPCDFYVVAMYPGLPPQPLGMEELGAALKKAGFTMSAEEFANRRDSVSTLVSSAMWQNVVSEGSMQKGDYLIINTFKAPNPDDWAAYEKKIWQPLAQQLDKEGLTRGWSLNVLVMPPRGNDIETNGVTVDVYPNWDAVYKPDPEFYNRWKKVHPDMELGTTLQQFEKLGPNSTAHLFKVDDMVSSAMVSSAK